MAVNSIGEFFFISLAGQVPRIQQQVELVARPGVDGVGLWLTGARSKPFVLRSKVDAESKKKAREYFGLYSELIGADPVPLVWSDQDIDKEGALVAVLGVNLVDCRALANSSSGGLNPPSRGWIECDWELVLVAIPPEE